MWDFHNFLDHPWNDDYLFNYFLNLNHFWNLYHFLYDLLNRYSYFFDSLYDFFNRNYFFFDQFDWLWDFDRHVNYFLNFLNICLGNDDRLFDLDLLHHCILNLLYYGLLNVVRDFFHMFMNHWNIHYLLHLHDLFLLYINRLFYNSFNFSDFRPNHFSLLYTFYLFNNLVADHFFHYLLNNLGNLHYLLDGLNDGNRFFNNFLYNLMFNFHMINNFLRISVFNLWH